MDDLKIGILRNEDPNSGDRWSTACTKKGLAYEVIDMTDSDWLGKIKNGKYHFILLRPPGNNEKYKKIYDERIYIISKILKYWIFPFYEECYIYENKKLLSDFLKARDLPHPTTRVFYNKKEAIDFLSSAGFPLVAKTSIGASGSGVTIINNRKKSIHYVNKAFSFWGIRRRSGPNPAIGTPAKWFGKAIKSPAFFIKRIKKYHTIYSQSEKDYVLFQEFIPHDFEWRMVKIGESYFGHRKVKYKNKASGSKSIDYTCPPETLLDFTRNLCDSLNFNCMAIDIFEDGKGGYLINELQTIFGHVQDYILEVNGKPGRFLYENNRWIFEAGDFNTNESYDLRLETAIKLFREKDQ